MLEILVFIFSSPWRFCGTLLLLLVAGWALTPLITIKVVRPVDDD
jgi:hypothetical protein